MAVSSPSIHRGSCTFQPAPLSDYDPFGFCQIAPLRKLRSAISGQKPPGISVLPPRVPGMILWASHAPCSLPCLDRAVVRSPALFRAAIALASCAASNSSESMQVTFLGYIRPESISKNPTPNRQFENSKSRVRVRRRNH